MKNGLYTDRLMANAKQEVVEEEVEVVVVVVRVTKGYR